MQKVSFVLHVQYNKNLYSSTNSFIQCRTYTTCIHLLMVCFIKEYNELHHLLIMEALGGNIIWSDRFLGYHIAIGYYWALNSLFFFSPAAAYEFMELLESHGKVDHSLLYFVFIAFFFFLVSFSFLLSNKNLS